MPKEDLFLESLIKLFELGLEKYPELKKCVENFAKTPGYKSNQCRIQQKDIIRALVRELPKQKHAFITKYK